MQGIPHLQVAQGKTSRPHVIIPEKPIWVEKLRREARISLWPIYAGFAVAQYELPFTSVVTTESKSADLFCIVELF